MKSRLLGAVCASFVAIVSPSTYATSYQYTSTQIPSLGGGTTWVRGVNDARQVVGTSTISGGEFRAFIYDNGAMTNLGTFGGNSSAANAINNNGYVTGYATTTIPGTGFYSNPDHAFFYNGTDMIDIGTLSLDETNSKGNAINDNNQIAGVSDVILSGSPGGGFAVGRRGFIYDDGVMTDINFGNSSVIYNGINDKGEIVGHNLNTPLYYYNGVTTDLTSVIGGEAQLKDINNSGMIVGVSEGVGFFLQDDIFTPLGTLGGVHSNAWAVNDLGDIVGTSQTSDGSSALFLYTQEDGMLNLADLVEGGLSDGFSVHGINNNGDIIIHNTNNSYLLTATVVPIPPALYLFGSGLLGLVGMARRKNYS